MDPPEQARETDPDLKRQPSRLLRAITSPNEGISALIAQSRHQDAQAKRLKERKFLRAFGGKGLDYGSGLPDQPGHLPPADSAIFPVCIDCSIEDKLPRGYNLRSLQRDDYDRGYTKLKAVGHIPASAWKEQCEWLRARGDEYTILVITDNRGLVCCTGTLLIERKFAGGLSLVGHIADLAVGEGQTGKGLGLRMLDQLDSVAHSRGCKKTVVDTQDINELFYKQKNFKRTGIEMSHSHRVHTAHTSAAETKGAHMVRSPGPPRMSKVVASPPLPGRQPEATLLSAVSE